MEIAELTKLHRKFGSMGHPVRGKGMFRQPKNRFHPSRPAEL
jgi:hypothetical protein